MIRVLLVSLLLSVLPSALFAAPSMSAPTAISPTGTISPTRQVTFEWNAAVGATWYYLWVSLPDGSSLSQWYDGYNICQFDMCVVTPGMPLYAGVYRWWLQAWSPADTYSEWSAEYRFTVTTFAPTPAAPTGTISETQPTFQWYASPGASWYYVWLSDANGHVLDQWFDAGNCSGGMCSVAPLALPPGEYRWWAQAWQSEGGYSPWSAEAAFTLAGAVVAAPTVIEPTTELVMPESETSG